MAPAGSVRTATALAHPNIALSKYWGKRDGDGNVPAVPSLSVTLDGLSTRTTVTFDDALGDDELLLNGVAADPSRARGLLSRIRSMASLSACARVVTTNDFPTASGLASSASAFAALAVAASHAAGLELSTDHLADLARRTSASAARSVYGGFVELDGTETRAVAAKTALDLRVLVCVTTEAPKSISSTEAMNRTAKESPYYAAWIEQAPRIHATLREAVLREDFAAVGMLAERSALAMHACAMAAGIVFVHDATMAAFDEVRRMRAEGGLTYATIDAGPHLKCLVRAPEAAEARRRLSRVRGVLRVIEAEPGDGARIVESSAD